MSWSENRAPLPSNWDSIRKIVFERDGFTCKLAWSMCTGRATEVDHVRDRDDHRLSNLRSVCSECHEVRSKRQAAKAARAKAALGRPRVRRHPGLL